MELSASVGGRATEESFTARQAHAVPALNALHAWGVAIGEIPPTRTRRRPRRQEGSCRARAP